MIDKSTLPKDPGCYMFKDQTGEIIYIGKAKNLKNRVSSYFNKSKKTSKTQLLVKQIVDYETIVVDTEVEALLLENKLIKKHKPKYNITLKDAKTYAYIKITEEEYPRILTTRKITKKGTFFGPYTDGSARRELIQLSVRLYKLRVCKHLPKKACLNYHIGLCTAPCINKVTQQEYSEQVSDSISFLKGDTKKPLAKLKEEMHKASEKLEYEHAQEKLRQINAIEHLHKRQKVDLVKRYDQDVMALKKFSNQVVIVLFSIVKGVIQGKKEYRLENEDELFQKFIKRYYNTHDIPHEIILSEACYGTDQEKRILEEYFTHLKGINVKLTLPKIGEKKQLVELALKNVTVQNSALVEIQDKLNLPTFPRVIECFDISNLGSTGIVAGMTRFINGKPDKSGYRKFEIRSVVGKNDDFASMREVIYRRYSRLVEENAELPDLIVVDGGAGQLSSALASLNRLHVHIPVVGLAKKNEELYLPKELAPRNYDSNSQMMLLLRMIRDSVHRFAVTYQRKKRSMKFREETK